MQPYAMDDDRIVGDGGGVTLYERPDGSRYALDARGRGYELCFGEGAIGPARFDARPLADGRWPGSRSPRLGAPDDLNAWGDPVLTGSLGAPHAPLRFGCRDGTGSATDPGGAT